MQVTILPFGSLRYINGSPKIELEFNENQICLKNVIKKIISEPKVGEKSVEYLLNDQNAKQKTITDDAINPALIILINDVDYRLLGGTNAKIEDGDRVVFIPSIHGG